MLVALLPANVASNWDDLFSITTGAVSVGVSGVGSSGVVGVGSGVVSGADGVTLGWAINVGMRPALLVRLTVGRDVVAFALAGWTTAAPYPAVVPVPVAATNAQATAIQRRAFVFAKQICVIFVFIARYFFNLSQAKS